MQNFGDIKSNRENIEAIEAEDIETFSTHYDSHDQHNEAAAFYTSNIDDGIETLLESYKELLNIKQKELEYANFKNDLDKNGNAENQILKLNAANIQSLKKNIKAIERGIAYITNCRRDSDTGKLHTDQIADPENHTEEKMPANKQLSVFSNTQLSKRKAQGEEKGNLLKRTKHSDKPNIAKGFNPVQQAKLGCLIVDEERQPKYFFITVKTTQYILNQKMIPEAISSPRNERYMQTKYYEVTKSQNNSGYVKAGVFLDDRTVDSGSFTTNKNFSLDFTNRKIWDYLSAAGHIPPHGGHRKNSIASFCICLKEHNDLKNSEDRLMIIIKQIIDKYPTWEKEGKLEKMLLKENNQVTALEVNETEKSEISTIHQNLIENNGLSNANNPNNFFNTLNVPANSQQPLLEDKRKEQDLEQISPSTTAVNASFFSEPKIVPNTKKTIDPKDLFKNNQSTIDPKQLFIFTNDV